MAIDIEELLKNMFEAGAAVITENGVTISEFAENELKGVLREIANIADNVVQNSLDPTQGYPLEAGKALVKNQIISLDSVLIGMEEMTMTTAQLAIEAVKNVVRTAVGSALSALV